jgi:anti-anti-sigma factor
LQCLECRECGLRMPHRASAPDVCPKCAATDGRVGRLVVIDDETALNAYREGRFEIRTRVRDDAHTVIVAGELDMASGPAVRHVMREALAHGAKELILDLGDIEFVDSEGFRILLEARELCAEHGCTYCLVPLSQTGHRGLELMRLIDRLPIRRARNA